VKPQNFQESTFRRNLESVAAECPPEFWRFATAVGAGSLAAGGTGWLVKKAVAKQSAQAQEVTIWVSRLATFWIAAGVTWVLLTRKS
jgi:hypothetical protein